MPRTVSVVSRRDPERCARRHARRLLAVLVVGAALSAGGARAQTPGTVSVDEVRVDGRGRHRLVVSVLDAAGSPVPGLEQGFRVTLDGAPVEGLVARAGRVVAPDATVTVVVDAELLRGESQAGVADALRELGRGLEPGDRIRVVAAGARARVSEAPARAADRLAPELGRLFDGQTPLLYDALYGAVRAAARLPERRAGVVLVLTRGVDGGSRRTPLEVVAAARGPWRGVPVMVVLLGESESSAETERLHRIVEHTGGTFTAATSAEGVGPTLQGLSARGLDRWTLGFRAPAWRRDQARHRLELDVARDGVARSAQASYETADALAPGWWSSPLPWLVAALALVVALALALAGRRRQVGLLVHDGDDQDGIWYELFGYPVTLGGATGNDIVLMDARVSRNHALMERRGGHVELVDLNSENGTFVNDERISRRLLVDGDRVSFGPHVHLVFEARG